MCMIYDLQNSQKKNPHAHILAGSPVHPMQAALFRSHSFIHENGVALLK